MDHDSDILITGGGLNGPATALALARAGFSVTVIDALPGDVRGEEGFDGRGYALALASVRLPRLMVKTSASGNRSAATLMSKRPPLHLAKNTPAGGVRQRRRRAAACR